MTAGLNVDWGNTAWVARVASRLALAIGVLLLPRFAAGETQWIAVRSPHFAVLTDGSEKDARDTALALEQIRAVCGKLLNQPDLSPPFPIQVIAFHKREEITPYAPLFRGDPLYASGFFQGGDDRNFILLDLSQETPWRAVVHPYVHQLVKGSPVRYQPWFEEGFAEYLSTVRIDSKWVTIGDVQKSDLRPLLLLPQVSSARLFRVEHFADPPGIQQYADTFNLQHFFQDTYNRARFGDPVFAPQAWLVVHYLYGTNQGDKVATYFDEIAHVPVETAINRAFDVSVSQFDKAVGDYLARLVPAEPDEDPDAGEDPTPTSTGEDNGLVGGVGYRLPVPVIDSAAFQSSKVATMDAQAILADCHLHSRDYREQAARELNGLVKADPGNAAALRGLGYAAILHQQYGEAAGYLGRASRINPEDARAHYYAALAGSREPAIRTDKNKLAAVSQHLENAIRLDATFADSYALLAVAQSMSGKPSEALATMQKAVVIYPQDEPYQLTLAELYLANGVNPKGIEILKTLRESDDTQVASQASRALAHYENQQADAKTPAPPADHPELKSRVPQAEAATVPSPVRGDDLRFVKGTLVSVDCSSPPAAVLSVVSGGETYVFRAADMAAIPLIGAEKFSCSWTKRPVAINYREAADHTREVVSLEVQQAQ
jgi:tetratricopeptide (TPR) repeat protein